MELLQTGGVSLKADIFNFLIEIFGCISEQLFVLNRAVDGRRWANYEYNSCSHTKRDTPWLVIDLQGYYGITYVRILNRGDCCSKYI